MDQYNSWCKWHPLKTVLLGRSYHPNFYRDIKNPKIRDCLIKIAIETEEDFLAYKDTLERFGIKVIRPELDIDDSIMNYINNDGKIPRIPRPPAQPRDGQLVMGNDLVYTCHDHPAIKESLNKYNDTDVVEFNELVNGYEFQPPDGPWIEKTEQGYFSAPCITCVGKRVFVDRKEVDIKAWDMLVDMYPEREFVPVRIGGHSDGCFHTLKPGAIITLYRYEKYDETFPGWDICYLPDQSWNRVLPFTKLKERNNGKWWLPGEEENHEFTNFVETWLEDWVGYVEESVFDVNVLMLNEKYVCVNNYNETIWAFLEKHGIQPIICPFRHRFFWDGGLHCITLDLYREGEMEDYFNGQ